MQTRNKGICKTQGLGYIKDYGIYTGITTPFTKPDASSLIKNNKLPRVTKDKVEEIAMEVMKYA